MSQPFIGYAGQVWAVAYASFKYFLQQLGTTSDPGAVVPLAETVYNTTGNALETLNINRIVEAWISEYDLLLGVEALPITVPTDYTKIFLNRVNALDLAIVSLSQQIPTISFSPVGPILDQDQSPIPDPNFLIWLSHFLYEVPPSGLTINNFVSTSQEISDAFNYIAAQVLAFQGIYLTTEYDVSLRFANTAQVITNMLEDFTSGPIPVPTIGSSVVIGTESGGVLITESGQLIGTEAGLPEGLSYSALWNQMVTSPAFLLDAFLVSSAPYTIGIQQDMVIRNLLLAIQNQLAVFLLRMRRPTTRAINQNMLLMGNSLMDFAAQNTGNFENWSAIATANNLVPPYVGDTSSPGIAGWGSNLIIPNPGTASSPVGAVPSYNVNYLGVDEYIGPINGSMPAWTGDYNNILGYENLRWALGRRIQTPLGALIYHSTYGCRIPGEVGNVQTSNTVGRIAAFGKSALQQDPRISNVLRAIAVALPNFVVGFQATVKPGGFGAAALAVNEVISPTTAPLVDAT